MPDAVDYYYYMYDTYENKNEKDAHNQTTLSPLMPRQNRFENIFHRGKQ